jgi:hypothetical protein
VKAKVKVQTLTTDAAVLEHCRIEKSCLCIQKLYYVPSWALWKPQWLSTSRRAGGNDCVEKLDTWKCVSKKSIRV